MDITILLDIIHMLEYLWRAAYAFHGEGTREAESWVEHHLQRRLQAEAVVRSRRTFCLMATPYALDGVTAKLAEYLVMNTKWLHYDPRSQTACRSPRA